MVLPRLRGSEFPRGLALVPALVLPLALALLVLAAGARAVSGSSVIITVAGGKAGYGGDGGPATAAKLGEPSAVAAGPGGTLYIAHGFGQAGTAHIRRVGATGIISSVVSGLDSPHGLAADAAGNLYFSDRAGVRRRSPSGKITFLYGPTLPAKTNLKGIALDAGGSLYVADAGRSLVLRISDAATGSGGKTTVVAGTGSDGFSGDGGAATKAMLSGAHGVAVDDAGNVYIADTQNHRVRRVRSDGVIETVVGNGTKGFGGDGDTATAARLDQPADVELDAAGNLYVSDYGNDRIRKVSSLGRATITTVAGTGKSGFSGDGGPAAAAQLDVPVGIATDTAGNLYIADRANSRIRKVRNLAPDATFKVAVRGRAPITVNFDASKSSDPDGRILTYAWAFGDGTITRNAGEKVSHTYTKAGTYRAVLTVMDDSGARVTASTVITVK